MTMNRQKHMLICIYIYMYIYVIIHICMHVCMHVCIYIYRHVHTYTMPCTCASVYTEYIVRSNISIDIHTQYTCTGSCLLMQYVFSCLIIEVWAFGGCMFNCFTCMHVVGQYMKLAVVLPLYVYLQIVVAYKFVVCMPSSGVGMRIYVFRSQHSSMKGPEQADAAAGDDQVIEMRVDEGAVKKEARPSFTHTCMRDSRYY